MYELKRIVAAWLGLLLGAPSIHATSFDVACDTQTVSFTRQALSLADLWVNRSFSPSRRAAFMCAASAALYGQSKSEGQALDEAVEQYERHVDLLLEKYRRPSRGNDGPDWPPADKNRLSGDLSVTLETARLAFATRAWTAGVAYDPDLVRDIERIEAILANMPAESSKSKQVRKRLPRPLKPGESRRLMIGQDSNEFFEKLVVWLMTHLGIPASQSPLRNAFSVTEIVYAGFDQLTGDHLFIETHYVHRPGKPSGVTFLDGTVTAVNSNTSRLEWGFHRLYAQHATQTFRGSVDVAYQAAHVATIWATLPTKPIRLPTKDQMHNEIALLDDQKRVLQKAIEDYDRKLLEAWNSNRQLNSKPSDPLELGLNQTWGQEAIRRRAFAARAAAAGEPRVKQAILELTNTIKALAVSPIITAYNATADRDLPFPRKVIDGLQRIYAERYADLLLLIKRAQGWIPPELRTDSFVEVVGQGELSDQVLVTMKILDPTPDGIWRILTDVSIRRSVGKQTPFQTFSQIVQVSPDGAQWVESSTSSPLSNGSTSMRSAYRDFLENRVLPLLALGLLWPIVNAQTPSPAPIEPNPSSITSLEAERVTLWKALENLEKTPLFNELAAQRSALDARLRPLFVGRQKSNDPDIFFDRKLPEWLQWQLFKLRMTTVDPALGAELQQTAHDINALLNALARATEADWIVHVKNLKEKPAERVLTKEEWRQFSLRRATAVERAQSALAENLPWRLSPSGMPAWRIVNGFAFFVEVRRVEEGTHFVVHVMALPKGIFLARGWKYVWHVFVDGKGNERLFHPDKPTMVRLFSGLGSGTLELGLPKTDAHLDRCPWLSKQTPAAALHRHSLEAA